MSPASFLGHFLALWFLALGLLIGYRLLTRRINLAGLLTVDGDTFSPSRLQLLLVTVSGLAAYATGSLSAHALLPIPNHLVALFGLSHGSYLGAKAYQSFFRNNRQ